MSSTQPFVYSTPPRSRPCAAFTAANISFMLSIYYLMVYEGGEIVPGDDVTGSARRW